MPMPYEPVDKYDLMDNLYMLDQAELDRLDSLGVDPDVSRAAREELLARSNEPLED